MPRPASWTSLDNGLRVVHQRVPGAARVAVCTHHGVGFRYESPDKEGFAHLFEHLMFQGSRRVPPGSYHETSLRSAAYVNGTTHQDYTDFQNVVSDWDLERVLAYEADRLLAPRLARDTLRHQIRMVQQEIYERTALRPYAGFPWPKTSQLLFDTYPNAHDGYGDMNRLCEVSLDDCAEFFLDWYTPANTVLTVVGDVDGEHVLQLAQRHLGVLPRRPTADPPPLDEGALPEDRMVEYVDPRVPQPGVSISYRLDGPERGLVRYLSFMVLAELLLAAAQDHPVVSSLDADVGYFGPLDALTPEVFNVVVKTPSRTPAQDVTGLVRTLLERLADPRASAGSLDLVRGSVRRRVDVLGSNLLERARLLGRSLLLLDRPGLLDELPEALARLGADEVAGAAEALLTSHHAVVVVSPESVASARAVGTVSRRVQEVRTPDGHDDVAGAVGAGAPQPAPMPVVRPQPPDLGRLLTSETTTVDGIAVVQARSVLGSYVELRLVCPVGPAGWRYPWQTSDMIAALSVLTRKVASPLHASYSLGVDCDGEHVTFSGRADPDGVGAWVAAVRGVVDRACSGSLPDATGRGARNLGLLADSVARQVLREDVPVRPAPEPGGPGWQAWLAEQVLDLSRATVVAVGPPGDRLTAELSGLGAHGTSSVSTWPEAGHRVPDEPSEQVVAVPGDGLVVRRYAVELPHDGGSPDAGLTEAAHHLAAALYGAGPFSRVQREPGLDGMTGLQRRTLRRRVLAGLPVAVSSVEGPPEVVRRADAGLTGLLATLGARPPSAAELGRVVHYCENELLDVLVDPVTRADHLALLVRRGVDVDRYRRIGRDLRAVTPADVERVVGGTYARPHVTTWVGDTT